MSNLGSVAQSLSLFIALFGPVLHRLFGVSGVVEIEKHRINVLSEWAEHVVGRRELAEILTLQQNGQLDFALVEDLVDVG